MYRLISITLLAGGVVLITYGVAASDSVSSAFSNFFTGNPTDKTIWLLLGGIVATLTGIVGLARIPKTL